MTDREAAVAKEILRIARDELRLTGDPAPGEALASVLDSMAILALVVAVEDRFRVILTVEDGAQARTLEDLARMVAARTEDGLLPAAASGGGSAP